MVNAISSAVFPRSESARTAVLVGLAGVAIAIVTTAVVLGSALPIVTMLWACLVAACLIWRLGVFVLLAYVTIEGLISNLVYPLLYPATALIEDALVLAVYAGFALEWYRTRSPVRVPRSLAWPFVFLLAVASVESFNPDVPNALVPLVGFRVLFLYMPLYVIGLNMVRSRAELERLVRFVLVGALPIVLFGVVQFYLGPHFVESLGSGWARTVWIVVEARPDGTTSDPTFRPASTFEFVGQFALYLFFVTLLAFAAGHSNVRARWRLLYIVAFFVSVTGVVIQSARTNWFLLPVAMLGVYALAARSKRVLLVLPVLATAVGAAILAGGPVLAVRVPFLLANFDTIVLQHFTPTLAAFARSLPTPAALWGHGTGTALGAIRYVTGSAPLAFELAWFQPFFMFGVLGLAGYVWLYAAVVRACWRGLMAVASRERWIPAGLFVYVLFTFIIEGLVNYPPANVYVWLCAGALAALWDPRSRVQVSPAFGPDDESRPKANAAG